MSLGARRRRPPTPGYVANDLWRRAGAVPSFHINPAALGHARDLITGTVLGGGTVNSATPAWEVGPGGILAQPAANAPVIAYDPATLRPLGLRAWELIVNRSLSTRDLTQAVWVKSGITPTRDQVGADGTANTATRLTATASDGTCLQTLTSASATHVSGFYVRRITGTGTVEITQNGGATWTAITLTSAFQRFAVAAATITNPQIGFRIRSNGDEIAVDLTQCQSASVLGPPLPNASTTLTASSTADVITITGGDFARIYNQAAVTMYADAISPAVASGQFPRSVQADDGTDSNRVTINYSPTNTTCSVRISGVSYNATSPTRLDSGPRAVVAAQSGDAAAYVNGASVSLSSPPAMPTTTTIWIGSSSNALFLNGYIRELAIFRSRRPNANLQAVTQ